MVNQTIIPPSGSAVSERPFVYGSVIARFFAMMIDLMIVSGALIVLFIPLTFVAAFSSLIAAPLLAVLNISLMPSFFLLSVFAHWLYFATMESGPRGATFGKRLFGLRVCTQEGKRLRFGRASLRYFSKIISAFPFMLGYIMAFVTNRKQALHDLIAETIVIRN